MSVSSIAGSAPPPVPAGNGGNAQGASGDDGFSRMLQGANGKTESTEGKTANSPRPDGRDADNRQVEGKEHDASRQTDTKARTTDAGARAEAGPAADDASATADAAGTATTDSSTDTGSAGDGWPPPGLASLLDPAALAPAPAPAPPTLPTTASNDPATPRGALSGNAGTLGAISIAARSAEPAALPAAASNEGGALALPSIDVATDTTPEPAPTTMGFVLHTTPSPGSALGTSAATALPTSAHAPTPQLHGEGFADDIGSHVQWLAGQKISHAHIRISPQELGPVEVRLQLDGDRISADFSSAQPEVRQALESSLPRLREMLGQHGFELAHAGVGQQSRQDGGQSSATHAGGTDGGEPAEEAAAPVAQRWVRRGLLDAYA